MKCMVIDGNSIINRAYYGIRPLTNREGLYTHAVFGFLTTLLRLKEEERPDALCVTFDLPDLPSQGGRGVQGHPEAHAGGIADAGAGAERGAGYPEHPPL